MTFLQTRHTDEVQNKTTVGVTSQRSSLRSLEMTHAEKVWRKEKTPALLVRI